MKKKKCNNCEKYGYKYITGTPYDVASLKKTIDEWSEKSGVVITLIGKPGGCTPGHPC